MAHRSSRTWATATLLLAAGLALTACGGEEVQPVEPSTTTSEVPAPSATPPQPSPPAAAPATAPSPVEPAAAPAATPHPEPGAGIQWVEGFAKGAATAKSPDEVLFVYVGRKSPT